MLVVGAGGEVYIIAAIDGRRCLLHRVCQIWQLVNGRIVADHHAVEAYIVAQYVLQYLAVSYAVGAMYGMVAWHHRLAAGQTYHRLVGQQYLLHHFFLVGITTAAVA